MKIMICDVLEAILTIIAFPFVMAIYICEMVCRALVKVKDKADKLKTAEIKYN